MTYLLRSISLNIGLLLIVGVSVSAQDSVWIEGIVYDAITEEPLIGANIYWTDHNKGTVTNSEGRFRIQSRPHMPLIISYVGFTTDTIERVGGASPLSVPLKPAMLEDVEVVYREKSTEVSLINSRKVETINEKELLKAACCALNESFETSPSVDVSFTDAITGTRQIRMLGLASRYSQITRENMPDIRGLATIFGMEYIPGTWIESIQIVKGAGSVVNGFESMAGQINVELRKPENADQLYLNLFANQGGRFEANLNLSHKINEEWSTATLLHGRYNNVRNDRNKDGFLDMPLSKHFIGLNRWKYAGANGLRAQFGIKGTWVDNLGGQLEIQPNDEAPETYWGMHLAHRKLESWAKIGLVFESMPWKSLGIQVSASDHEQDAYFGLRNYDASHRNFYANFIYRSILSNTNHVFSTGISYLYDDLAENIHSRDYQRIEKIPGAFFEYTYTYFEEFSLVAGIRIDHHNLYGGFVTPRLHIRYAPNPNSVLRASFGRGQKTPNIFTDNIGLFASAREFSIQKNEETSKPYGLEAEVSWNTGINYTQVFKFINRDGRISLDLYHTQFENQIVVDLETPGQAKFYNLSGQSLANSFQCQIDYELANRLDFRIAYRFFDVRTSYETGELEVPLISRDRAFLNVGYQTKNNWKFDWTVNWQGKKRLPNTKSNPEIYRLNAYSPSFTTIHFQISKVWNDKWDIYLGGENLLDTRQENPILAYSEPFSDFFDSSLTWGPIFGRNIYIGMRYRIK